MPRPQKQSFTPSVPPFLSRLREKNRAQLPRWLDWHFATMLAALLVLGLLLWLLSPILAPFLAAGILAYIFDPVVDRMEARGLSRTAGTVVAVLLLLIAVAALLLVILPLFYKEIVLLTQLIPNFVDHLRTTAVPWINDKLGTAFSLDVATFKQVMSDNMADASGLAKRVVSGLSVGGMAVVGFMVNLLLIPVVLFYLLRDWDLLLQRVDALVPRRFHHTVRTITGEVDGVLSEFLRGQLSVMLIMAVFYVTGLWAVGLNFALPVGLITGLLVFIPYLGSGMGFVLGTIAAVMQFQTNTVGSVALVWAVFVAGQVIEGFAVTPWLVGDRIGLHPVAVLFALLAFGQLFGFFGLLLALPASAAILVALRHVQAHYTGSGVYQR